MSKNLAFIKMYSANNDFVIIDAREDAISLTKREILKITNRKTGIGCDQLLILKKSQITQTSVEIYNNDASRAESCGNGLCCVAKLLMDETDSKEVAINVSARIFHAEDAGRNTVKIGMGTATFNAGLTEKLRKIFGDNVEYANVGNPHVVFCETEANFKKLDIERLEKLGDSVSSHKLLPNGANVEFMYAENKKKIHLKIFERGVGITEACGSGACAAAVVAFKNGLCLPPVKVVMPGGFVFVEVSATKKGKSLESGSIALTATVNFAFAGWELE
jgi:diaminopimelate epimerase